MSILDTLPYEAIDLEAKKAGGRDGRGALPKDVWETYSSFANTSGGVILLGVSEDKNGNLYVSGVPEYQRVIDDFWNILNDPSKTSINILCPDDIQIVTEAGLHIIKINIPQASPLQKPIFINGNALTGTYVRRHTGDFHCSEAEVQHMLAEQMQNNQDNENN